MKNMVDSFWRALAYCFHPKVILLTLLPLFLMLIIVMGLGMVYWDAALESIRAWIDTSSAMKWAWVWLERVGLMSLKAVVAPLIIIVAVTPLVVVMSLLAVSFMMTPALVNLVAERRFANLERRQGGSMLQSVAWTVFSVVLALGALVLTLPLWWLPPLAVILPALIWGWLTYRVMTYDVLSEHASRIERIELMRRHRFQLLAMGVVTGMMGAAPSLVWASGALFVAAFVVLIPIAVWIYTLVFVFSALWFGHFLLNALAQLRNEPPSVATPNVHPTDHVVDVEAKISNA
jgi:Etoposide-induced protein 2.4 (EI24)